MALTSEFKPLELGQLRREASVLKADGWRFIQTHAVKGEAGIDLYYSFMKNGRIVNYRIEGVKKDDSVPSITDVFLAAFVFENEARELFGVDMRDIAIDFGGAMYAPVEREPMTFISPEQKAAKEKAAKAAAAKAAKEAAGTANEKAGSSSDNAAQKRVFVMTPEREARLEAKLATMSPEKVAKVEAALKARRAEAAQAQAAANGSSTGDSAADKAQERDAAGGKKPQSVEVSAEKVDTILEAKIAGMPADKAAKVRAALGGMAEGTPAPQNDEATSLKDPYECSTGDAQVERILSLMDENKAKAVREALAQKGGN